MQFLWQCYRGLVLAQSHSYVWYPVYTVYRIIHLFGFGVKFGLSCVGAIRLLKSVLCDAG